MSFRLSALIIIAIGLLVAVFVYPQGFNRLLGTNISEFRPFRLGLDLLGGTHLVYKADLANLQGQEPRDAMEGVRDVIERRVNAFGVAEPLVQVEGTDRLVVELAGIKDVNQAIQLIGQTPLLEFKEARIKGEQTEFIGTALTGKYLKTSRVVFDQNSPLVPQVSLEFNDEGAKLFAELTKRNIGKPLAIYLDGKSISEPVVQAEIKNGQAVITGRFTPQEARDLVNRLNAGALPVPISLISQQTIGASLGQESLQKSLTAGLYGLLFVSLFMILFYRVPGIVSVIALLLYVVIVLSIYKLIPVTITLSGIAGFVLSLGIAVDANVLIFARMREELAAGKSVAQAVQEGFHRAWHSIRDGHVTTLLGAAVLYLFTTSIVKGFALTLGIGVLTSLLTATVVTRIFLLSLGTRWFENKRWLF